MRTIFSNVLVALTILFVFSACLVINRDKIGTIHQEKQVISCVLQDAMCHDGTWSLYDRPAVFDEQSSEIMAQLLNGEFDCQIAAFAELINGCYIIHLD